MFSSLTLITLLLYTVTGSPGDHRNIPQVILPYNQENVRRIFLEAILKDFGSNGTLDSHGLSRLLEDLMKSVDGHTEGNNVEKFTQNKATTSATTTTARNNVTTSNATEFSHTAEKCQSFLQNKTWLPSCVTEQCYNSTGMLQLFNFSSDKILHSNDVLLISPAIVYQSYSCKKMTHHEEKEKTKIEEAWAYGFLCVTLINICALVGVVVLPIMNTKIYKKVLLFLVALAVGSLVGSGILVLIPESFQIAGDHDKTPDYLWMGTTIMGGIYIFFLIERFLKLILQWRKNVFENRKEEPNSNHQDLSDIVCSVKTKTPVDVDTVKMKDPATYHASAAQCTSHMIHTESQESITSNNKASSITELGTPEEITSKNIIRNCKGNSPKPVQTVAWMIIFGDGFHNFIDGLSIGAAFTSSILTGVSVSVAVICEELPHELGDFAILLNSGMSLKKALLFNFLSACMCYIGLILGIILGEISSTHRWVFGIAGGMFLYIALVDMIPEMNSVVEASENQELGTWPMFLLQNVGMVTGFGVILIISYYADNIDFFS